jgi:large subunit ribosomal protein L21
MLAIIEAGGKQHRVDVGTRIRVEKLPGEAGAEVTFDRVLLYSDGQARHMVGAPYLDAVKVTGKVLAQGKDPKIIVFKQKQRKGYRRKRGHRQPWTQVEITGVTGIG